MLTLTWHPGAVVFPWPAGTGTRGPRPHTRQKVPPCPPIHAPARGSESAAMEAFRVPGTVLTVRYRGTALVRPGRSLRARSPPVVTVPAARPWGTDQVRGRRLAAAGSRHHALRAPTPLGALRPTPHRESSCLVTPSNGPIACHVLGSNRQHP